MNKVILFGRVKEDPTSHGTGKTMNAKFTVITSEHWKNPTTGQTGTKTDFHNIVVWGFRAQSVIDNVKAGSLVALEGKQRTRSYEVDGQKKWVTEVVVDQNGGQIEIGDGELSEPEPTATATADENDFQI